MPRLTKRLIDETLFPTSGQVFVRDAELPGFALRVTKGRKSFILEKRIHGRMRRFTLGPYGPLTVDEARKLAQREIGAIAQGQDPAQERQDRLHEPTFGVLPSNIWSAMHHGNGPRAMIRRCSLPISRSFAPGS
jgi:hypothetical protein